MERKLSLKEAKELYPDHNDRFYCLPIARVSNRFDSREQIERAAVAWVTVNAKVPNWLLLAGDDLNPERPIAAKGWYEERVERMRELASQWDNIPDWDRPTNSMHGRERAIYRAWYKPLTPPK